MERLAERDRLLERERGPLGRVRARDLDVPAGVVLCQVLLHGEVHHLAHDRVELVDAALRHAVLLAQVRVDHVEQRQVAHEHAREPALHLLELALVGLVRERGEVLEELALLVPPPPELGHRHLVGVGEPALQLATVVLERPPRVRLGAVDRPLRGPDVLPRGGVLPQMVPDPVDFAPLDLLDLAAARDLRHGRPLLLRVPRGPWCGRGAARPCPSGPLGAPPRRELYQGGIC